jgi:hypothetical protein
MYGVCVKRVCEKFRQASRSGSPLPRRPGEAEPTSSIICCDKDLVGSRVFRIDLWSPTAPPIPNGGASDRSSGRSKGSTHKSLACRPEGPFKNSRERQFPRILKMNEFKADPQRFDNYRLISAASHVGANPERWHYTTFCLINNQWWSFSDSRLTIVGEPAIFDYNFPGTESNQTATLLLCSRTCSKWVVVTLRGRGIAWGGGGCPEHGSHSLQFPSIPPISLKSRPGFAQSPFWWRSYEAKVTLFISSALNGRQPNMTAAIPWSTRFLDWRPSWNIRTIIFSDSSW